MSGRVPRAASLYAWALSIAVLLWFQVHGQGESTLSMDVALQMRGLPPDMVLINDLPDHVKVTISGLQARLKSLDEKSLFLVISAGDVHEPGVIERPVDTTSLRLPPGLTVDKIQPDRFELKIDRLIRKAVDVDVRFDLAEGWEVEDVRVHPSRVTLVGPEIWLEPLSQVPTEDLRPPLRPGPVELRASLAIPAEKAVKLLQPETKFLVHAVLRRRPSIPTERAGGRGKDARVPSL